MKTQEHEEATDRPKCPPKMAEPRSRPRQRTSKHAHILAFLFPRNRSLGRVNSLQSGDTSPSVCFMSPHFRWQRARSKVLPYCSKTISRGPRTHPVHVLKRIQETINAKSRKVKAGHMTLPLLSLSICCFYSFRSLSISLFPLTSLLPLPG